MKKWSRHLAIIVILTLPILAAAQPPTFDDESPYGVTDVPFDDYVWILVVAALGIGLKKAWDYKKLAKQAEVAKD